MKSETEVKSLNIKLAKFLPAYRNAPHSTTGEPPSQLFLGRRLRPRLDLLKPDLSIQVNNRHIDQSVAKGGSGIRHFSIGQRVIARNYSGHSKWVPVTVRTQLGPLSYEVEIEPNLIWLRHTDQLKACNVPVTKHSPVFHPVPSPTITENHGDQVADPSEQSDLFQGKQLISQLISEQNIQLAPHQAKLNIFTVKRYPTRVRKPPARLDL